MPSTIHQQSASANAWRGLAFEDVCMVHSEQIRRALGIEGILVDFSPWHYVPTDKNEKGAQIDLLINRSDRIINICEMKFCVSDYRIDKKTDANIRSKIQRVITLDDLFQK